VAVNIREPFLKDPKEGSLELRRKPFQFIRNIQSSGNSASLAETFDVPAGGGGEAGFVQQGRMQKVRQRPRVGNSMLDELLRLAKEGPIIPIGARVHIEVNFRRNQTLAQTVVQFSGNAAAFIVLNAKQPGRKPAQRDRALFHKRFEGIDGPAQRILGLLALPQVIANF
jgi:hypothetical protein